MKMYPIYKGLEMPLVFRGFRGRFIFWAMASLFISFSVAGVMTSVFNVYLGLVSMLIILIFSLLFILDRQKKGQHLKSRDQALFIYPATLKLFYEKSGKKSI